MTSADRPFGLLEDIAMVQDAARGFLLTHWPESRAVMMADQPDEIARIWHGMAQQGWTALGIDDGDDTSLSLCLTIMQELGRAACPAPLLDVFLTNITFQRSRNSQTRHAEELSARLLDGRARIAWIFGASSRDEKGYALSQTTDAESTFLDGQVSFVENSQSATHFIVVLDEQAGRLAVVSQDQQGLRIVPTPGLTAPALADIRFDRVRPLFELTSDIDLRRLRAIARLLLTGRAFGAAQRGFELLTDYVKVRSQFGRKIGSYQAIQHKLANLLINIETCRLTLLRAGAAGLARGDAYPAAVAVGAAARTLRDTVLEIHHGFGGVSFWEDHEMPRHFRRVHGDLVRHGGVHEARREIATALLGGL